MGLMVEVQTTIACLYEHITYIKPYLVASAMHNESSALHAYTS